MPPTRAAIGVAPAAWMLSPPANICPHQIIETCRENRPLLSQMVLIVTGNPRIHLPPNIHAQSPNVLFPFILYACSAAWQPAVPTHEFNIKELNVSVVHFFDRSFFFLMVQNRKAKKMQRLVGARGENISVVQMYLRKVCVKQGRDEAKRWNANGRPRRKIYPCTSCQKWASIPIVLLTKVRLPERQCCIDNYQKQGNFIPVTYDAWLASVYRKFGYALVFS